MKKILKRIGIALTVFLVIVLVYAGYVFLGDSRLEDNIVLEVANNQSEMVRVDEEYTLLSYNIGFGAYTQDFSFFMDGGTSSRATSQEALDSNLAKIQVFLDKQDADFTLLQEVDEDATRTFGTNERAYFQGNMEDYASVFAQNWDSQYLMYPILEPHGASKTGILTFSQWNMTSSLRRSLPKETGVMKIADLDRCYSVTRLPVEGGKELVLYNFHLSAYTSDGSIADEQAKMMIDDMQAEYEKGNYVVAGGDFNKDLLGDSSKVFGVDGSDYTWAKPFKEELLNETNLHLQVPYDEDNPVPTCRNTDEPYHDNQFVLTIDGFITSDNIEVTYKNVVDLDFEYSDHNPVEMRFKLK